VVPVVLVVQAPSAAEVPVVPVVLVVQAPSAAEVPVVPVVLVVYARLPPGCQWCWW
jgi:hypothetical protein